MTHFDISFDDFLRHPETWVPVINTHCVVYVPFESRFDSSGSGELAILAVGHFDRLIANVSRSKIQEYLPERIESFDISKHELQRVPNEPVLLTAQGIPSIAVMMDKSMYTELRHETQRKQQPPRTLQSGTVLTSAALWKAINNQNTNG